MITLPEPPRLVAPTTRVRTSFLVAAQADCLARGLPSDWVAEADDDFAAYVAQRRGVQVRWGVPSTVYWYVSRQFFLGSLVLRHELTDELAEVGGHIGYHVLTPWQRQGHATRMLDASLAKARRIGLDRVLLTCDRSNEPSRRVILANGGEPDGRRGDEDRFWISL